jgi:hypothetical protein
MDAALKGEQNIADLWVNFLLSETGATDVSLASTPAAAAAAAVRAGAAAAAAGTGNIGASTTAAIGSPNFPVPPTAAPPPPPPPTFAALTGSVNHLATPANFPAPFSAPFSAPANFPAANFPAPFPGPRSLAGAPAVGSAFAVLCFSFFSK